MSQCFDKKYGDMLYAYELGMLAEEEKMAFEQNLLNCPYCCERIKSFQGAADIIRKDDDMHEHLESLAEKSSESTISRKDKKRYIYGDKQSWS